MNRQLLFDPRCTDGAPEAGFPLPDNGGRRWGQDRRRFVYTSFIPERRSGLERRCGPERRRSPRFIPAAGT